MSVRGKASFLLVAALTGVVGDLAMRGSGSVAAAAGQHARVAVYKSPQHPPVSIWVSFGRTTFTRESATSFSISPSSDFGTDSWFGAALPGPSICNYRIRFTARLETDASPNELAALGTGYALLPRGQVRNDVPFGDSVQYDPPFEGLRTVHLPDEPNQDGHHVLKTDPINVRLGVSVPWNVRVEGRRAVVWVGDGPATRLDLDRECGGDIVFRVWNGTLRISDLRVAKLHRV